MADDFNLDEILGALPEDKRELVREKWDGLNKGFTQASQRAAELERQAKALAEERETLAKTLQGYDEFYRAWLAAQTQPEGVVTTPQRGTLTTRSEGKTPPPIYDPEALSEWLNEELERRAAERESQLLSRYTADKQTVVKGLTDQMARMLTWERELAAITAADPQADRDVIIKTAMEYNVPSMQAAYRIAYHDAILSRVAKEAATKAAEEAKKQLAEQYEKARLQAQIEGAGSVGLRKVIDRQSTAAPKTRQEAESRAVQELIGRMAAQGT